jgi:hypothetical protein
VKAPRDASVRVTCRGTGCPAAKRSKGGGRAKRLRRFERSYRGGTRLEIRVTQAGLIGSYVKLRFRSHGRAPVRSDTCLWPGERAPRACPAG